MEVNAIPSPYPLGWEATAPGLPPAKAGPKFERHTDTVTTDI